MQARDAAGRRVSLLNDDYDSAPRPLSFRTSSHTAYPQPYYAASTGSASSSPNTPELLRSSSYDSQVGSEPLTPLTPLYDYAQVYATSTHEGRSPYDDYVMDHQRPYATGSKRPSSYGETLPVSYEDESPATSSERPGKRYPCRYRDSHGCEKTFTTSGHASRHSKIHTAEKAVPCAHPGCSKKFTRADNMKQHLETHYKDKSRSSATRPSLSSGDRRSSSSTKLSLSSRKAAARPSPPRLSHSSTWDMRTLNLPLLSRPPAVRSPSSGLDALAMAVACQDGA